MVGSMEFENMMLTDRESSKKGKKKGRQYDWEWT